MPRKSSSNLIFPLSRFRLSSRRNHYHQSGKADSQARSYALRKVINALSAEIEPNGFKELVVGATHAALVELLRDLHRDPFDRFLIG